MPPPLALAQFKVNSLGPIHNITAFLPLLRASSTRKIVVIGSGAGNVKAVQALGVSNMVAYSMTKATALMATTKFAIKPKDEGFVVVSLGPGLVDTTATAGADGKPTRSYLEDVLCANSDVVRRCANATP